MAEAAATAAAASPSEDGYARIYQAVAEGKTEHKVRAAIQAAAQEGLARSLRAADDAGRGDLVGALLEAGADAKRLYPGGLCDPLALCIAYGNASSLNALLKLGHPADRRIKARPDDRSLAGHEGYFCTALHLCIHPPRLSQDECLSYPPPNFNCLKVLLEEGGADANSKSRYDETPLHFLCMLRKAELGDPNVFDAAVDLLLANGADVNARDSDGRTPLVLCAERSSAAWVPRLLARGADPEIVKNNGGSALMCACGRGSDGRESSVAVLALLRASSCETLRASENNGWTPIDALVCQDAPPRLPPSSTPRKTRAVRELLLSGVTCRDDHAPVVVPIAAELMALQDVELEELRSWAEKWQGHYECVSYSFDRLDKEAEEARTVELVKEEARLLALLRGEEEEEEGGGGGGGGGRRQRGLKRRSTEEGREERGRVA
jgi:ankyrin repeat protein